MRKRSAPGWHWLAAMALAVGPTGRSEAFLDVGTLITNAATATFSGGTGAGSVTFSATARLIVANPVLFLWKEQTPTSVAAAGGTVTYTICFSNGGANTAFNVTIKDRMPNNSYFAGSGAAVYSAWAIQISGASLIFDAWSSGGVTWSPNGALPPGGQPMGVPASGAACFLQWVVPNLGIGRSGCIVFSVYVQ